LAVHDVSVFECKESVQKFGEVRNNDVAKFIQNIIVEENLFIVNDTCKGKNVLLNLFADGKNVGVVHTEGVTEISLMFNPQS